MQVLTLVTPGMSPPEAMTESVPRNCLGSKGDGKIKLLLGEKSISNDWWEWGTKDRLPCEATLKCCTRVS